MYGDWNILQVFSREYTHKDYCLAHLFTDLKFEGGILGLAYVGSPRRNSVGGICTPGWSRAMIFIYVLNLSLIRHYFFLFVFMRLFRV